MKKQNQTLDCAPGGGKVYTRDAEQARKNRAHAQAALDTIRRLDQETETAKARQAFINKRSGK